MTKAHEAWKVCHARAIGKDPRGHSVAFALVEATSVVTAHDTRRILAAVLQEIEGLVDLAGSVHGFPLRLSRALSVERRVNAYGSAWITAMIPHMMEML